jgi:ketosteroid isomerase-like protein
LPTASAAFAQQAPRSHDEAQKIAEEGAIVWMNTYVKHDAKAIAALFLPDAAFMPPDGSPVVRGERR